MRLEPRWCGGCIGLRCLTIAIASLYLAIHIALLVLDYYILHQPETMLESIIGLVDTRDQRVSSSEIYRETVTTVANNSGEYMALPITVNAVLILFNLLAVWGAAGSSPLLLLPWLLAHIILVLFGVAVLIYIMILLQEAWFRAIFFLVAAPIILIVFAFWLLVLRLYLGLRQLGRVKKEGPVPIPPTVYTPEPHSWDAPLPIWAVAPPSAAWDPQYLQQIDPRYLPTPGPSSRGGSNRSRKSSTRSRSRSKSGGSEVSYRERQSDSMSLSDKYGTQVYSDDPSEHATYEHARHEKYGRYLAPVHGIEAGPEEVEDEYSEDCTEYSETMEEEEEEEEAGGQTEYSTEVEVAESGERSFQ